MLKRTEYQPGGELLGRLLSCAAKGGADEVIRGYDMRVLSEAFRDGDLTETCFCLFKNDLNISKTAAELYMHRNTLIYRIAKLKRITGLDVRRFSDAVSFIILYSFVCGEVSNK